MTRTFEGSRLDKITIGHPLVDKYLEFAGARLRLNSWVAVGYDLKVFFAVVNKEPASVCTADVFNFIKDQRRPRRGAKVVRLEDGEAGLSSGRSNVGLRRFRASTPTWWPSAMPA